MMNGSLQAKFMETKYNINENKILQRTPPVELSFEPQKGTEPLVYR